jgi:hypothetical protein
MIVTRQGRRTWKVQDYDGIYTVIGVDCTCGRLNCAHLRAAASIAGTGIASVHPSVKEFTVQIDNDRISISTPTKL